MEKSERKNCEDIGVILPGPEQHRSNVQNSCERHAPAPLSEKLDTKAKVSEIEKGVEKSRSESLPALRREVGYFSNFFFLFFLFCSTHETRDTRVRPRGRVLLIFFPSSSSSPTTETTSRGDNEFSSLLCPDLSLPFFQQTCNNQKNFIFQCALPKVTCCYSQTKLELKTLKFFRIYSYNDSLHQPKNCRNMSSRIFIVIDYSEKTLIPRLANAQELHDNKSYGTRARKCIARVNTINWSKGKTCVCIIQNWWTRC